MTEPQISPLARRLAEENSIDWRVIPGTGPESRVIERDILTYLARIMSGEIDPPTLPDASEPASIGGATPDLSEVSNLAAASAGMAKEGIDLSSLLSGTAVAVGAALVAPVVAATAFAAEKLGAFAPAAPAVTPVTTPTEPMNFHAAPADALPSSPLDFSFSDEPIAPLAASQITSLEQISFGEPLPDVPAAFEAPISFGEPVTNRLLASESVFSAAPAKLAPSDSTDAEFEIDLDDFDDVPTGVELIEPGAVVSQIAAPEFIMPEFSPSEYGAANYSFAPVSSSAVDDDQLSALESPDLTFDSAQADPSGHQADLVLDVDSTSEAPLTIAALEDGSEIDDDLVMADVVMTDASSDLQTNLPVEAFNLEPVAFESLNARPANAELGSLQLEPVNLESVNLESAQLESAEFEPVHLESAQFESADSAALIAPIQHDDFELDLIDADELSVIPATSTESIEPTPLEPTAIAGGLAAVALIGGTLTSTPPLDEPVDSQISALSEPTPDSPVVQPAAVLEVPANQLSAGVASSSVVSGFFQGFAVRRHFDAAPLSKMQRELTLALNGREVPLAVFLARAAQRNLHALGTGDVVTLTRLGDTLEPLHVSGMHHSFIEAVQSVARATPGTMDGLLILDASSLGADDLVLPGAWPVLTLNVKGEHGHLALSGELPMGKAAEFLAHVALALETPVSLVI